MAKSSTSLQAEALKVVFIPILSSIINIAISQSERGLMLVSVKNKHWWATDEA